jgi:hypothetical protein
MSNKITSLIIVLFGFFWLSTSAASIGTPQKWRYKVFLDEQEIGYQTVSVNPEKTQATVQIEANFNVKFLFFTAYRYRHNNRETWQNDCIKTIESRTNDNGDTFYVTGKRENHQFALLTHDGPQTLQGCVRTFAYWDPRLLKAQRLLNSQTGEYLDVDIHFIGNENIVIADALIASKRYRLRAENIVIDLWYSESMQWLALQTSTEGGNQLRYQLEQIPL